MYENPIGHCEFHVVDLASKKYSYDYLGRRYAYYPTDHPTVEIAKSTQWQIAKEGKVVSAYYAGYGYPDGHLGDESYTVKWGHHYFRVYPTLYRYK